MSSLNTFSTTSSSWCFYLLTAHQLGNNNSLEYQKAIEFVSYEIIFKWQKANFLTCFMFTLVVLSLSADVLATLICQATRKSEKLSMSGGVKTAFVDRWILLGWQWDRQLLEDQC